MDTTPPFKWRNGVNPHVILYDLWGPTAGTKLMACERCGVQAYVVDKLAPMTGFVRKHAHKEQTT